MSESTGTLTGALFRANKRRKIHRKRNIDDNDDYGALGTSGDGSLNPGNDEQTQTVRRPIARKHGLGFSTAGSKVVPGEETPSQTALVPFQPEQDDDQAAHDRFVKPAGKAAVVEDKHLTAYVDSKLAEVRSLKFPPAGNQSQPGTGQDSKHINISDGAGAEAEESSAVNTARGGQQLRQRNAQRVKPIKKRRGSPQRDAHDIARDAMVDQIMRESQVPLYDQPSSQNQERQAEDFDADEAAAQAFKAEFLYNLEQRQNRRRPAAPPVQQRGAPPIPSGPKLGGSRAQREKMKAIETAKAAGKSVDAVPKRR